MKTQTHNNGELKELRVSIDKEIVECVDRMVCHTGISREDIVVIALKRFRACHADYEGQTPSFD